MRMVQKIMFASVLAIFGSAFILSHPANAAETKCAIFSFKAEDGSTKNTDQVCVNDFDKDGKIKTNPYFGDGGGGWRKVEVTENGQKKTRPGLYVDGKNIVYYTNVGPVKLQATGKTWDDFVGQLSSALSSDLSLIAYDKDCVGVAASKCEKKKLQYVGATKKKFKDSAAPKKIPDTGSSYDKKNDTPIYQPASSGNTSTPAQANEAAKQTSEDAEATSASGDDDAAAACFNNTGALGWVMCSIINVGGPALTKMINNMIEPFLQIDVRVFAGNGDLFGAWQQFQIIANFAFVAIFMITIFSQLTGVGIGNYGIKKILPKLIIGAILINASFIICQLAVEVSNISGLGIKNLFQGIANNISEVAVTNGEGQSSKLLMLKEYGTMGVIMLAVAGFGVAALVSAGPVPILLTLIVLTVAVVFLFVLLAIRHALSVLLVVISPIAFAAYLLDGTKKTIFNNWFNLFKALLLAYPLISLVLYGGQAVARVLVAANSTQTSYAFLLAAAIASVAPIFFIPSLIVKSFGSLSGFADKARKTLTPNKQRMESNIRQGRGLGKIKPLYNAQQRQAYKEKGREARSALKREAELKDKLQNNSYSARKTRRLNNELMGVSMEAQKAREALISGYGNGFFGAMGQDDIVDSFQKGDAMYDKDKSSFVSAKWTAGMRKLFQDDQFFKAYAISSKNKGFNNEMNNNKEFSNDVAEMVSKHGAVGLAMAKAINGVTDGNYDITSGSFRTIYDEKLQKLPNNSFDGIKKDMINEIEFTDNNGNAVSFDPLAAAKPQHYAHIIGQGLTGADDEALTNSIVRRGEDKQEQIMGSLNPGNLTGLSPAQALALGGFGEGAYEAGKALIAAGGDISQMSIEGYSDEQNAELRTKAEAAIGKFSNNAASAINELNSSSGDSLRGNMNQVTANLIGVHANQGPTEVVVVPKNTSGSTTGEDPSVIYIDKSGSSHQQTPPDPRSLPDYIRQKPAQN